MEGSSEQDASHSGPSHVVDLFLAGAGGGAAAADLTLAHLAAHVMHERHSVLSTEIDKFDLLQF